MFITKVVTLLSNASSSSGRKATLPPDRRVGGGSYTDSSSGPALLTGDLESIAVCGCGLMSLSRQVAVSWHCCGEHCHYSRMSSKKPRVAGV